MVMVEMVSESLIKDWLGVVIAATMWSLWLNRNRGVFENKFYKIDEVLLLIKIRSYAWCQATNLVPETRTSVWNVNPVGIISGHRVVLQRSLMDLAVDILGFTDGSFTRDDTAEYKSGMGGVLKR